MRGTFANIRIKNEMVPGIEGGCDQASMPSGESLMTDLRRGHALQGRGRAAGGRLAGKEYGTGSSRDWAAKGTRLLGVKAVMAESFERIHRSNLIGMGVLPLQFTDGDSREGLGITGDETFDLTGIEEGLAPRCEVTLTVHRADGSSDTAALLCRIDTLDEVEYFKNGGILQYVLRNMMGEAA